MRRRFSIPDLLPFVAVLGGLSLSVLRFRADDPVAGLAYGLSGVILMIALSILLPSSPPHAPGPVPRGSRARSPRAGSSLRSGE